MFSPTLKKNSSGTQGMSRLPQNLTNARVLFSTSIDHFESLEFAQAQLREKSHFTSLFSSQSAVFALCHTKRIQTHRRPFCTPKPDADLCIHVDLPLDKTNCGKSGLGYRASGPTGRRAVAGRGPRAAGPSGRRAAGPWRAAGPRACF